MFEHNGKIVKAMRNRKSVFGFRGQHPALAPIIAEHPALAPIIAEDNEVIHSLVETGYERWLRNIGTKAIIEIPVKLNNATDSIYARYMTMADSDYNIFGYYNGSSVQGLQTGVNYWRASIGNDSSYYATTNKRAPHNVVLEAISTQELRELLQDGVSMVKNTKLYTGDFINAMNLFIFDNRKTAFNARFAEGRVWGEHNLRLIPFQRASGECGVVDIISGVFYGNSNTEGTFTIELTEK